MHPDVSAVIPGILYISRHEPAKDRELLRELEILHVVRCGNDDDFRHYYATHDDVTYHDILIDDDIDEDFCVQLLDEATQFIHFACGPVLVHCFAGISRSSTIVLAYLMRFNNMHFSDAWQHLQKAHPRMSPNSKFVEDLIEYYKQL